MFKIVLFIYYKTDPSSSRYTRIRAPSSLVSTVLITCLPIYIIPNIGNNIPYILNITSCKFTLFFDKELKQAVYELFYKGILGKIKE